MLNVNDLINIKYLPEEKDISLALLVEFYETYLCKRIFKYELEDGREIKIFFKDTSEIFHVSGVDHIYGKMPMDGTNFVIGIKDDTVNFDTLRKINKAAYKDYIDRIRCYMCVDTIIKNCEYLWFTNGKIDGSEIKVKYLLLKGLDDKNLHLGIDTYKEGRPYFAKTLLVTEKAEKDKFIQKANERLRVAKLEIIDKETGNKLEYIDRVGAKKLAHKLVEIEANKWKEEILSPMVKQWHIDNSGSEPTKKLKRQWENMLKKHLENKKSEMVGKVVSLDKYWGSKIVAECIRDCSL